MSTRLKATVSVLVAFVVAVVAVGCTPTPPPAKSVHAAHASFVSGQAVTLATPSGVTVQIPAGHLKGAGSIAVTPATRPHGQTGFHIALTRSKLVGTAIIRVAHALDAGEPAPLVGWSESATGSLHYASAVKATGSTVTITTDHFSFWFLDFASDLLKAAKAGVSDLLDLSPAASPPTCSGTSAEKASGITVTSSSGNRVYWCLGTSSTGKPQVTIVNARHYAVAVESTPGLSLQNADNSLLTAFPRLLTGLTARVGSKSDHMALLQGGQSYTFVDNGTGSQGVNITPNPAAYLADTTMFALQTVLLLVDHGEGGAAEGAASESATSIPKWQTLVSSLTGKHARAFKAFTDGASCLLSVTDMETSDMTTAKGVVAFLDSALQVSLGCMKPALSAADAAFASAYGEILGIISWVVQGVHLLVDASVAIVDTLLGGGGYRITLTPPAPVAAWKTCLKPGEVLVEGELAVDGTLTICTKAASEDQTLSPEIAYVTTTKWGSFTVADWGYGSGDGDCGTDAAGYGACESNGPGGPPLNEVDFLSPGDKSDFSSPLVQLYVPK